MIYKLKENIPHDTAFIYVDESSKSVKDYQGENWTDKAVLNHSLKQKTKGFFSFFLRQKWENVWDSKGRILKMRNS
ncbi:MAG: hypothetical protein ACO2PO_12280 [Candidatus Calescibacterium sp.]